MEHKQCHLSGEDDEEYAYSKEAGQVPAADL